MKITIDLRSAFIGLVAGVLLILTLGAVSPGRPSSGAQYEVAGTHSHAVIINTQTGQAWTAFLPPGSGHTDGDFKAPKLR